MDRRIAAGNNGSLLGTDQKLNFTNHFSTEVLYKNGSKETILHIDPPSPDGNRTIHFKISSSEGLCINLDEVRRYHVKVKAIATKSDVEIVG